jgi:hypothetical protein
MSSLNSHHKAAPPPPVNEPRRLDNGKDGSERGDLIHRDQELLKLSSRVQS